MIGRDEVIEVASQIGLRPQVVEKDYVLGWVLAGISRDPELRENWVFKGGTCLKKCYFETYRFSEDLDFTVLDKAHLNEAYLVSRFTELSAWLYDETGIELPVDKLSFKPRETIRGGLACDGRISYRGPIAPNNKDLPRIKLDLTADEKLVLAKAKRPVAFPYTDLPENGIHVDCYAYAEVFGEKVRALTERASPRDLYDVINLFRHEEFSISPAVMCDVIKQKCDYKQIPFPSQSALELHKDEMFADWENMLAHQLPQLPPAESFWNALTEFFEWLAGRIARVPLAAHPQAGQTESIRLPLGGIYLPGRNAAFIEVIRFAAANRLCVDLDYSDINGKRSTRAIEPYSLRRSKDKSLLLMAVRADSGEPRSYLVDQIHDARVTNRTFTPRYEIELTPTMPVSAPMLKRTHPITSTDVWGGASQFKDYTSRSRTKTKAAKFGVQPVYVYRCPICGKKFERTKMDATLRGHKGKNGYACYGNVGIYVRTIYK